MNEQQDRPPCPHCHEYATVRYVDKHGVFWVCSACGHNRERIRGPKRRTVRRKRKAQ